MFELNFPSVGRASTFDRPAQILDRDVRVHPAREPHVRVPQQCLRMDDRDAPAHPLGRCAVAQGVQVELLPRLVEPRDASAFQGAAQDSRDVVRGRAPVRRLGAQEHAIRCANGAPTRGGVQRA